MIKQSVILLILSAATAGARDNVVALPKTNFSISVNEISGLQDKFFEKKLVSKPEYTTNTYIGNFQTSFAIDLPKNDFLKDGLWFDYSSSSTQNTGFGAGFDIRLPKISSRDEKLFYLAGSSNELVQVKTPAVGKRLSFISQVLGQELIVSKYYRLKDEADFSLFLKTQSGFLQLTPNGETNVFNEDGWIVKKILLNKKVLSFVYSDNKLVEIKSPLEKWNVSLSYKENEEQVKFINGRFVKVPKGLNTIVVGQNQTKRNYIFNYNKNLLVSVKKEGALRDVFKAGYQGIPGRVYQSAYDGRGTESKNIVFRNFEKKAEFIDFSKDSDRIVMNIDLNGDFVTDEVVMSSSTSNAEKERVFKNMFAGVWETMCDERCSTSFDQAKFDSAIVNYQNYLNSTKYNLSVRFGKFSNKIYELEADSSLNLAIDINAIGSFKVVGNGKNPSVTFEQHSAPRFMDIDNNGKKDLVFCSNQEEKSFVEATDKQDILVQSVFNLSNRPGAANIFNFNGKPATAYLFKTNEKRLSEMTVDNVADIYHVAGASFWEKRTPSFNCHSQSIQMDFNGDGFLDLMTGKTVYLLGENLEVQTQVLNNNEIAKMFDISNLTEDSLRKGRYGLVDVQGDGTWEAFLANNYFIHPTDRTLHIISEDKEVILERPSHFPLMTSMESTFGGKVNIEYGYADGAYVVKKIIHDVKTQGQSNWEESFNYEGTRWHVQKNIFLGAKKSIVTKKIGKKTEQKILEFDLDNQNGTIFYIQRARKAGRVVSEKIQGSEGVERELKNTYFDQIFSNGRSYSYVAVQEVFETGKLPVKTVSNVEKYEGEIPVVSKELKVSGKHSLQTETESFVNGMYLLRDIQSKNINQSGEERVVESNQWDEMGRLVKRSTPVHSEVFEYDLLGRVLNYETSNGAVQRFTYEDLTSLLSTHSVNDLTTSYKYTDVENEVAEVSLSGSQDVFKLRYTTDGVLTNIARGNQEVFKATFTDRRTVYSQVLDEQFSLELDGFGRVTAKTKYGEGDNLVLFKKSLDDQGRALKELSPFFEQSPQPGFMAERVYDGLGNILSEVLTDDQGNSLSDFVLTKDKCSQKMTETGFKEIECKDGFGQTVSTGIPNEVSFLEYGFNGEVIGVSPFEHSYKRNANGDIVESHSKEWGSFIRRFNYIDNTISYADGVIEQRNPYGDFKAYSNGLESSSFVSMSASYDKQLLKSLQVQAGNRNYTQSYQYNGSRVLVKKNEFNTTTEYALDAYDRVEAEQITDKKNSYQLEYKRTSGLITAIKPYIQNIIYSPLMKPALVEFSNGSSIEYTYGPRGELLSYSLTNGMNVLYSSTFEYGSDLKLLSQRFIRSGKLQEEAESYSYDNQFQLVIPAQYQATDRDNRGQVLALKDLRLGYHHLNLIEVKAGGQTITNYYGKDNHFFGSCDSSQNCFYKISPSEVELNGETQRMIEIAGVPVGILYQGEFYPAIIDHRMALIGLGAADGNGLKFLRSLDAWGNTKDIIGDKNFEKQVAFSYGRLMQNPLVKKASATELYFSNTRTYSPLLREWMSPDATVVWMPERLVKQPGNWNPFKYANNDPVNMIDESGRFANFIIGAGIGMAVGGATGAITAALTGGDVKQGMVVGAMTGAFTASGVGLLAKMSVSFAAEASVVSIFSFTGSLFSQAVVTAKVDMVDALVSGTMAPFAYAFGKLFNKIQAVAARELVSGLSFMPADISVSVGVQAIKNRVFSNSLRLSESTNSSYNVNLNTLKLKTSYGN